MCKRSLREVPYGALCLSRRRLTATTVAGIIVVERFARGISLCGGDTTSAGGTLQSQYMHIRFCGRVGEIDETGLKIKSIWRHVFRQSDPGHGMGTGHDVVFPETKKPTNIPLLEVAGHEPGFARF